MDIGTRIKSLRTQCGMSQNELAQKIGYTSRTTISKIESGNIKISTEDVVKFAKSLHTTVPYLMGLNENENNEQNQSYNFNPEMSSLQNKKIMSKNIQYYMDKNNKSRNDMCEALGVKYTTFTDWVKGNTYPRIDKIELMANYFGIPKSDLVEDHSHEQEQSYYLNPETSKIAQQIYDNKELSLLFDAAKDAEPEDLQTVHSMLMALKRKEKGE